MNGKEEKVTCLVDDSLGTKLHSVSFSQKFYERDEK
jgi:hypothetical protein